MESKTILGVRFHAGSAQDVVKRGMRGGLVVVPSAPVLVGMADDAALCDAVTQADLAITDSGLMVLLWWLMRREKLERVSGLEYLKLLLAKLQKPETGDLRPEGSAKQPGNQSQNACSSACYQVSCGDIFWIMPSKASRDRNLAWLRSQGFTTSEEDCYLAPQYPATGPLTDEALLALIQQRRPAHIIIALGGGVQERLGFWLREALRNDQSANDACQAPGAVANNPQPAANNQAACLPGIHCIGAAIGFLSGEQVRIPMWVDYLYLGWLWRSVSAPRRFVPRYWRALRLGPLMLRYGANAPSKQN